jgi:hypothetical protein
LLRPRDRFLVMKKILLSIGLSTILLIGYLMASTVVVVALSERIDNLNREAVALVDVPLRLPKLVYYYIVPPTAEDYSMQIGPKRAVLAGVFYVANTILYAVPIYFMIRVFTGYRELGTPEQTPPPPPPDLDKI